MLDKRKEDTGNPGKRHYAQSGIVAELEMRNWVIGFFCLDQPLAVFNMFRKSLYISASISFAVK